MTRIARRTSEADIYHVTQRGVGRQQLFEDEEDRACFVGMLAKQRDKHQGHVLAWCLMGNRIHLLLQMPLDALSSFMRELEGGYASYFNKKHERIGHLYEERYGSVPVDTEEQLLMTVRYIHLNPVKVGLSPTCDYRWSSYREYMGNAGVADTAFVMQLFGSRESFESAHAIEDVDAFVQTGPRRRLADSEAREIAENLLGKPGLMALAAAARPMRDEGIAALRRAGLSCKQVERFTSIRRGIVERVKWR